MEKESALFSLNRQCRKLEQGKATSTPVAFKQL